MSIVILCITMLIEIFLGYVQINRNKLWDNAYRRSTPYRKAILMVRLDRITTHRY